MHHQYPRRDGGEAALDAGEIDAPEIAISMHLVIAVECNTSTRDEMAAKPPLMRAQIDAPEIVISMHLSFCT
jgi:tRNA 2-selenouridine synthase SelU